ncbi:MAG: hypothetical protein AAF636_10420 [Pseudomonadota bacterium]
MIRPEAKAWLLRHREMLAGAALCVLGSWWLVGPGRLLTLPALGLLIAGAALLWVGRQRGRFRTSEAGAGVVQVTEGQITYMGPLTGGVVALQELARITLDRKNIPAHWRLDQPGQDALFIPVNAAGADALFDAFSALPGLHTQRMLAVLKETASEETVIWQRSGGAAAQLPLH